MKTLRKILCFLLLLGFILPQFGCDAQVLDQAASILLEEWQSQQAQSDVPALWTAPPESAAVQASPSPASVSEDAQGVVYGEAYSDPESVAEYLHTFSELPPNYITKNEAKKLGWDASAGNLWKIAPGKSIGGDHFGNYEGHLPKGHNWFECDINYDGGRRNAERILYSDDGLIFYTEDHYSSFIQLY